MTPAHPSHYLESKVLTAPPHRLHLMLIEGAIRFGRQADEALRRGDTVGASPALLRMLDIVGELLAGVRGKKSLLNNKLGDFYWFMFCRVSLVKINGDAVQLAELLRLLEYERETWQMVCDKFSKELDTATPGRATVAPVSRHSASGFSLEA